MRTIPWWVAAGLAVAVASPAVWADEDPSIACFAAMPDNSALVSLRGKVVLTLDAHPDLSMFANDHRPTKPEKDAIVAWDTARKRCYDVGHDYRVTAYQPVVSTLIDESMHATETLVAKLYAGKLTYAQFNQQRQVTDDTYRERIARVRQTLQAESNREQPNERVQRAAGCVTPQQREESEVRIAAMTRNFDPVKLGQDLARAGEERSQALDAVQKCQAHPVLNLGCSREVDLYNVADAKYEGAAQAIDVYRTMAAAQANALAVEAPVCR